MIFALLLLVTIAGNDAAQSANLYRIICERNVCTADLREIFIDGFESGGTSEWTGRQQKISN